MRKAFERLLIEAIDDALYTLGDSARQSIYFHLETEYRVPRTEIPRHIEEFAGGLERIFGAGSRFLEILIMKKLHEKVGLSLELGNRKNIVFIDYIKAIRQSYLQRGRQV